MCLTTQKFYLRRQKRKKKKKRHRMSELCETHLDFVLLYSCDMYIIYVSHICKNGCPDMAFMLTWSFVFASHRHPHRRCLHLDARHRSSQFEKNKNKVQFLFTRFVVIVELLVWPKNYSRQFSLSS